MKSKIKCGIKIYTFLILYVLATCFIYSFYLNKSMNDYNTIVEVIIGSTTFLLIGMLYSNAIHKHGIWIGTLVGFMHLFLIKIIFFLSLGEFNLDLLPTIIYILSSAIGGILGIFFKKII